MITQPHVRNLQSLRDVRVNLERFTVFVERQARGRGRQRLRLQPRHPALPNEHEQLRLLDLPHPRLHRAGRPVRFLSYSAANPTLVSMASINGGEVVSEQ